MSTRLTNNNAAVEGSNSAKMETKTRKAGTRMIHIFLIITIRIQILIFTFPV